MELLIALLVYLLPTPEKDDVFVCKNGNSTTYHSKKECRRMKNCAQEVLKVSFEEATEQYKKKACKLCYKDGGFQIIPFPVIVPIEGEEEEKEED